MRTIAVHPTIALFPVHLCSQPETWMPNAYAEESCNGNAMLPIFVPRCDLARVWGTLTLYLGRYTEAVREVSHAE